MRTRQADTIRRLLPDASNIRACVSDRSAALEDEQDKYRSALEYLFRHTFCRKSIVRSQTYRIGVSG